MLKFMWVFFPLPQAITILAETEKTKHLFVYHLIVPFCLVIIFWLNTTELLIEKVLTT